MIGVVRHWLSQLGCMQVSYYSLLPRLTHLAFGMLGSCATHNISSARALMVRPQSLEYSLGSTPTRSQGQISGCISILLYAHWQQAISE